MDKKYTFNEFMDIIRTLRSENGCPWDRKQTHESLRKHMIEETYEAVEAIDNKDYKNLCEELGDMLLQVALHTTIAEEQGEFLAEDVLTGISTKMIHRHPHVFGDVKVSDVADVLDNWDKIKLEEKGAKQISDVMVSIPKSLPSLIRCEKVQKEASKVGLDFSNFDEALTKVYEEIDELIYARKTEDMNHIHKEYGELLFSVVNLSRFLLLNAENSLTNATNTFINRFVSIEHLALSESKSLSNLSIDELSALWGRVK